jgi:hypothetical protein
MQISLSCALTHRSASAIPVYMYAVLQWTERAASAGSRASTASALTIATNGPLPFLEFNADVTIAVWVMPSGSLLRVMVRSSSYRFATSSHTEKYSSS